MEEDVSHDIVSSLSDARSSGSWPSPLVGKSTHCFNASARSHLLYAKLARPAIVLSPRNLAVNLDELSV